MTECRVQKPVFILATGRAGSTVLYRMLSEHPRTRRLTRFARRSGGLWRLLDRVAMWAVDAPLVGGPVKRLVEGGGEHYDFWDRLYPGFRDTFRDLTAEDATPRVVRDIRRELSARVGASEDRRFLLKLTGWPRVGFLKRILPDARFAHIIRDGRAVANSWLNVPWWTGWSGPRNWRWGPLNDERLREWESCGRSFIALAAIQWKVLMDAFEAARAQCPEEDWLQVRYEDLCARPAETAARIAQHCALPPSRTFRRRLKAYALRNANFKWRRDLTDRQQEMLNDLLGEYLDRYGCRSD